MGSVEQPQKTGPAVLRAIPILLSVLTMCAASVTFVVSKVGEIDKKAEDARRDSAVNAAEIKRVENNQITAQRDVRDDLKDISRKIDTLSERLYDRTGVSRPSTREWTK